MKIPIDCLNPDHYDPDSLCPHCLQPICAFYVDCANAGHDVEPCAQPFNTACIPIDLTVCIPIDCLNPKHYQPDSFCPDCQLPICAYYWDCPDAFYPCTCHWP